MSATKSLKNVRNPRWDSSSRDWFSMMRVNSCKNELKRRKIPEIEKHETTSPAFTTMTAEQLLVAIVTKPKLLQKLLHRNAHLGARHPNHTRGQNPIFYFITAAVLTQATILGKRAFTLSSESKTKQKTL